MKKVLFILCFYYVLNINAQDLRAYLTSASFSSIEGSYIETYLAFDANTLYLEKRSLHWRD